MMLSPKDNETLTRVGPGTPMGEVMRRYWIPALLTEELAAPDGPPVRVLLLGERLLAFRDTSGRVGLVAEACPHRGASLWFGRNEEDGIRCVFHGWKFDADGHCVDMMNEPERFDFKAKVRLRSYPTLEQGGVVWTYMGPAAHRPVPPDFLWTRVPETHLHINKTWQECNWLQGLEGGIDTSHAPIMHRKLREDSDLPGVSPKAPFVRSSAPILQVETTDYGYRYFGVRQVTEEELYVRGYHFVMPFTQLRPGDDFGGKDLVAGHMWVPMDDENCMVYNFEYSEGEPMEDPELVAKQLGTGSGEQDAAYRKVRNRGNDYLIDRHVQRTETFTGIYGVNTQDHALQESMGPVSDRSIEHLGPADKAIITARKLLLDAVQTVADGGDPPGVDDGYHGARALSRTLPKGSQWHEAIVAEMYRAAPLLGSA